MSLRMLHASVYDKNFHRLVASLPPRRSLAASTSSSPHAAISLCPPSMTVSTHTSASNAVAFQSPALPSTQTSLCTQSIHYISFPPRPLRTAPSRLLNTIRFGNHAPLIRMSVPAHKSIFVRNVVSNGQFRGGWVLRGRVKLGLGLMHRLGMITHHSGYKIAVLSLSRCPKTHGNALDTQETQNNKCYTLVPTGWMPRRFRCVQSFP